MDTEKIFYGHRMLIDAPVSDIAKVRAWHVSKVNRISPCGVVTVTLAQVDVDLEHDVIETDDRGNVIGMWANLKGTSYSPIEFDAMEAMNPPEAPFIAKHSSISFAGKAPEIKVGGSYKKYTVSFFDNEEPIDPISGVWDFAIEGVDASELLDVKEPYNNTDLSENQIKVKFLGDMSYVGKVLTIIHTTETTKSKLEVSIVSI